MEKVVWILLICAQTNGDQNFKRGNGLLDFLRRSGDRISVEAQKLTKDLKHVVDVVENSNYYLMVGYGNGMFNRAKNTSITYKSDGEGPIKIPTTTEEESNAILGEAAINNTTEPANQERTNVTTLVEKPNDRAPSAFSSMLLKKIYEAATAKNKSDDDIEFSTEWMMGYNNPDDVITRSKRHVETTETTTEPPTLQQSEPLELNQCISKWDLQEHRFSEKKHLDGLQKELEKMEELIQILQEQQHILDNMSDIDKKYYEFLNSSMRAGNVAEQRRLVELLEVLNTKLSSNSTDFFNGTNNITNTVQHMQEMLHLKSEVEQLKLMVETLPTHSQEVERKLSKEIEKQRNEIFDIKRTLRKLTGGGKVTMNGSTPRASENGETVDPQYIQQQIKAIQQKIDELIANGKQDEPILREGQQNPETAYLISLQKEVEHLKQLVDKSLKLQQEFPYNEVSNEEVNKLENEEKQLLGVKKVIEDILKSKMERKRLLDRSTIDEDVVLGEPLHHQVKVPHLFHIAPTPQIKHAKPAKAILTTQADIIEKPPQQRSHQPQSRSNDSDDIKKFLKGLEDPTAKEDEAEDEELENRILDLKRQLKLAAEKKRKKVDLEAQIRFLEQRVKTLESSDFQSKSLPEESDDKATLKLLKRILQQMEKSGRDIDETDTERELKKLAEAINRLRPKDNDLTFETEGKNDDSTAQFQLMLNKLIAQQNTAPRPAQSAPFSPQQMDFLINKLTPQYQGPSFAPSGRYIDYQPNYPPPYPPQNNFFRDYPKNYPPNHGGYTGSNQPQLDANPEQPVVDAAPYAKQKIEDLRQQIYSLQNAISNLDNPNYVKKPEDEETIYKLEQQINNLKNIVSGLNQYPQDEGGDGDGHYNAPNEVPAKPDAPSVYSDKPRKRREAHEDDEETERFVEHTANFLRNFLPKEETQPELLQRSSTSYGNLQNKLLELEKQLGERRKGLESKRKSSEDYETRGASFLTPPSKLYEVKKAKTLDIFEKVITKVIDIAVDKIAIAIPILIRKLFGITVENLGDYNPSYGYGGSVQSLKDLGIFGYLPLIILKLVDGFSYFISVLKKNKFLKTFLIPVLVLAGVLGFIVFLIWWLQPDDSYNQYGYLNYDGDKYYGKQYDSDYYKYNTHNNYENSRTAVRRFNGHNYM